MSKLLETANKLVSENSYFHYDQSDEHQILFSTRENGCVGSETHSEKDLVEARKIAKILQKNLPNNKIEIEVVDEWVHVSVLGMTQEVSSYVFHKHSEPYEKYNKGSGFSQGVKDISELKEISKRFAKKDIEPFLEQIKDKSMTESYDGTKFRHITICGPNEKCNVYGYYFTIEEISKKVIHHLDYTSL